MIGTGFLAGGDRRCRGSSLQLVRPREPRRVRARRGGRARHRGAALLARSRPAPTSATSSTWRRSSCCPRRSRVARRELLARRARDRVGRCSPLLLAARRLERRAGPVRLLRRARRDVLLARRRPAARDATCRATRRRHADARGGRARRCSASALAAALRWAPGRLAGAPARAARRRRRRRRRRCRRSYTLTKYVNGAGSKAAAGLNERAFVDRALPRGVRVGRVRRGRRACCPSSSRSGRRCSSTTSRSTRCSRSGRTSIPVPPGDGLGRRRRATTSETGRLRSPVPLPEHLVVSTHFGVVGLRGEVLRASGYVAVALVRVPQPATLAWRSSRLPALRAAARGRPRVRSASTAPGCLPAACAPR